MSIKNKLLCLGVASVIVSSNIIPVYASEAFDEWDRLRSFKFEKKLEVDQYDENREFNKNEGLKIYWKKILVPSDGKTEVLIPVIKNFKDESYEKKLNEEIQNIIGKDIEGFKEESQSLSRKAGSELKIGYQVKNNENIISVIINVREKYEGDRYPINKVYTYNIDRNNQELIKISDIFKSGTNYVKEINSEIMKEIAKDKDKFYQNDRIFETINENQGFYLNEEGEVVIVFKEGILAPEFYGAQEFKMPMSRMKFVLKDELVNEILVLDKKINVNNSDDIQVMIPEIKGLPNKELNDKINKEIENNAYGTISEFKDKSEKIRTSEKSELMISYEIKSDGRILSFVLNKYECLAGSEQSETTKEFYNVDIESSNLLKLEDFFKSDFDYKSKIDTEIKEQIEKEKEKYNEGENSFKTIGDNPNFYIDQNGNVTIEFLVGEIAPRTTGTPKFRISNYSLKDNIKPEFKGMGIERLDTLTANGKDINLNKEMYISDKGILMIPLNEVVEQLGFKTEWNEKLGIINLVRGEMVSSISLNENEYYTEDGIVLLDEKTVVLEGTVYIPQDFLDFVLKAETRVDIGGILNIEY